MKEILKVYTKQNCSQCVQTKNYLKAKNVEFIEIEVKDEDIEDLAERSKAFSFPVIEDESKFITMKDVFEKY